MKNNILSTSIYLMFAIRESFRFFCTVREVCKLRLSGVKIGKQCKFRGKIQLDSLKGFIRIGKGCFFGPHVFISCSEGGVLEIGDYCHINQGCYIVARKKIVIGSNCLIGEYSSIRDNDHKFQRNGKPFREQGFTVESVNIDENVWIGRNVCILKGVQIGSNSVIGAHSVVTKDVKSNCTVAGVPAKKIEEK